MGFFDWVGGLFSRAGGKVADVVGTVIHVFQVLWNLVQGLGRNVGRAWHGFTHSVATLVGLVESVAASAYHAVAKIATVTIPNAIRNTLRAAFAQAARLASAVKDYARAAYRSVLSYASRLVAELRSWTSMYLHYTLGLVAEVRSTLAHVARVVDNLLSHPDRLVTWILPTLVRALLRLVVGSAEAIARFVLKAGVRLVLGSVHEIESVIADII